MGIFISHRLHRFPQIKQIRTNRQAGPIESHCRPRKLWNRDRSSAAFTKRAHQHQRVPIGSRRLKELVRVLPWSPVHGERVGNNIPSAARITCSVIRAHAGAIAFESLCVPTSGCAFPLHTKRFYDVNAAVLCHRAFYNILEPCLSNLPLFVFGIPFRLIPMLPFEPDPIVRSVRQTHE